MKKWNLFHSLYCTRTKRLEIIVVGNEILKVNTLRSYFDLDLEILFCGSLDIIDRTAKDGGCTFNHNSLRVVNIFEREALSFMSYISYRQPPQQASPFLACEVQTYGGLGRRITNTFRTNHRRPCQSCVLARSFNSKRYKFPWCLLC